jgi:hypothetical protein
VGGGAAVTEFLLFIALFIAVMVVSLSLDSRDRRR